MYDNLTYEERLNVAIGLTSSYDCKCDGSVGHQCEGCFLYSLLIDARNRLDIPNDEIRSTT